VAVTFAYEFQRIDPAFAENVAEVEPAATATEEGVARYELLSDRETVTLVDAAAVSVTVQTVLPPDLRLVGEQAREARAAAGGVRLTIAVLDAPFKLAVTVTA
jgi:hypothetical protein